MKLKAEIFRNLDAAIEKSDDKAMIPLIQGNLVAFLLLN